MLDSKNHLVACVRREQAAASLTKLSAGGLGLLAYCLSVKPLLPELVCGLGLLLPLDFWVG